MELTAVTEIDAVNEILSVIGESPVNTLENLQNVDAINALRLLRQVSRQEQGRGWSFNIESEHILTPDSTTHKIRWQDNYLYLKGNNGEKLVRSGDYIKDLSTGETKFDAPISAEAVLLVPFEELPEPMSSYITARASLLFQTRFFGSTDLTSVTKMSMDEAWMRLQEYEIDNNNYNILNIADVTALKERG